MKKLLIFIFLLPLCLTAQPEFSFDLYFEDALGNRDTVTIGYDPQATDGIDELFGEENIISQPWDSVLDVRIGNKTYTENTWLTDNTYLSKKQIISSYCNNSITSSRISLQFYAKNYPLKFKWDKSQFENDTCRFFSVFFGEIDYLNIDAISGTFLQYSDSLFFQPYTSNLGQTSLFAHQISSVNGQLTILYPINTFNTFNKEIGVCQFVFYSYRSASLDDKSTDEPIISPNPVNSNSNLQISIGDYYQLYNIQGNLIKSGGIENKNINLENIPTGSYYIKIFMGNDVFHKKLTII
ncbi:MAG: T9SS type A sorting domain-containing protein [Flavobacteriales bacterium]|nr:T9SS type A sorting domain-containing protein [Flavobacteriales bacterium]